MSLILDKLELVPVCTTLTAYVYPSPFHPQQFPSLSVNLTENTWYDQTLNKGGQLTDFVSLYLRSQQENATQADVLRWIKNMASTFLNESADFRLEPESQQKDTSLILKKSGEIEHLGLVHYLNKQAIPLAVAKAHLKQLYLLDKNRQKNFTVLGFVNEEGGYQVENPFFTGCIRPQAISFIRGSLPKPDSIHVFKSFWDFLSVITQNKTPLRADAIVLNDYRCLGQVMAYLHHYDYQALFSWLDNDSVGEKATRYLTACLQAVPQLKHKTMARIYAPHQSVHAWHLYKHD
ncbi:hypothetical protein M0L20_07850 [Spirosoma sp. RP8]|uniref:Toprim domain-containing protein n=1 Tax=Spirosoma liriopis TaxID=2937440 RepID=A0ABT0HHW8_9BACT|nr:hypothetical protein [Spirosoma liriopis]MCK8491762.1 hypothetical protein [Spirosoma liriopis]